MKVLSAGHVAVILALGLPCFAQDKKGLPQAKEIAEFKKRTKVEPYLEDGASKVKICADDICLFDGPGKNGRVEVETKTPLEGQIFLSVRVEGEEVARFWVRSLAKPVKLPPTVMVNPEKANYSSNSQSTNGKSSCKIDLGGTTIYEGPGSDTRHELMGKGDKQSYSVRVDDEVVYSVPVQRAKKKDGEGGKALGGIEKQEPGQNHQAEKNGDRKPLSGEAAVAAVIERLNLYRKGAGLREVVEDKELSKACQMHAQYLALNPDATEGASHREDQNRKGFSEAGSKCAPRSLNNSGSREPLMLLESLLATLYHREDLLSSKLIVTGIGTADDGVRGFLVVDVGGKKWDRELDVRPVLFPYPDQQRVPLAFGGTEWPDPLPERGAKAGYPITLSCDPLGWKPGEAVAFLRCGDAEVSCWLSTPEKPANATRSQPGIVCLIPKSPLKPLTKYTVTMKCKQYGLEKSPEWSKTWSFTTIAAEK